MTIVDGVCVLVGALGAALFVIGRRAVDQATDDLERANTALEHATHERKKTIALLAEAARVENGATQ